MGLVAALLSTQVSASATSGLSDRFLSVPAHLQERIVCSIAASIHYDVPANIVLAVAEKEAVFGDNYPVRSATTILTG